jgi:hypothetical protein
MKWKWAGSFLALAAAALAQPIRLHPDNPHYFLFRGKPAVLVTSGEHYGAMLNLDFDYARYFKALAADRLNLTRTFTGVYREVPGNFRIARNTLAPEPGRFIAPWAESGGKFDLTKWNHAYFVRLRDFVREAGRRGVVIEFSLFCPYYQDSMWEASPLHPRNNVNGVGAEVKRTDVLALKDARLTEVQTAMVRKIVAELRDFDNLYYEICNEPYFGGVTLEWQAHIARTIAEAEAGFPARHLIAQNIANGSTRIEKPDPLVSLFNFHYSRPPESVAMNYGLGKAIGLNETGFDGTADAAYRIQGWDFLIAGGALYNNLDYSFVAGHEDGTFAPPATQPGGGSPALRRQLRVLRDFMDRLELVRMRPGAATPEVEPAGASARLLENPGRQWAVYLHHGRVVKDAKPRYVVEGAEQRTAVKLSLPAGRYRAVWVDTRTGAPAAREEFRHAGGVRTLPSPAYTEDIALRVERTGG